MSETNKDPELFLFFTEIGIIEQLARNRLESVLPDNMRMSHFVLLNHLVRLGAYCLHQNREGLLPMHLAARHGHVQVVK